MKLLLVRFMSPPPSLFPIEINTNKNKFMLKIKLETNKNKNIGYIGIKFIKHVFISILEL